MGLVRRRRGWPKNAGRGDGAGTERTRVGRFMPVRLISFTGNGSPRFNASRNEASPQPAGETTPHPTAYGPLTTTSAESGKRWHRQTRRSLSKRVRGARRPVGGPPEKSKPGPAFEDWKW